MGKTVGKILGIAAVVGSILLAIPTGGGSLLLPGLLGVSAGAASAIVAATAIGAALLTPKPKVGSAPVNSSENLERLRANIDPRTPRKTVIGGPTAMRADIR